MLTYALLDKLEEKHLDNILLNWDWFQNHHINVVDVQQLNISNFENAFELNNSILKDVK